jgi:hypothetical protein
MENPVPKTNARGSSPILIDTDDRVPGTFPVQGKERVRPHLRHAFLVRYPKFPFAD